jgi:ribosomal protein L37AE/L43A
VEERRRGGRAQGGGAQGCGSAAAAAAAEARCPRCDAGAVEVDFEGLFVCQACGHVVDEATLV